MVTIVAKITLFFRVEYRQVPPFFFDSNGGNGGEKNANNFGHDHYCIFGQKPTSPIAVSLWGNGYGGSWLLAIFTCCCCGFLWCREVYFSS